MRALTASLLLLAVAAFPPAAAPQDAPPPQDGAEDAKILLRGATVLTMAGEPIPDGGVLINATRGKIASVGRALPAPDKAQVIDCAGRFVVPGFIDASTRVGLVDIDLVRAANDSDEGQEPSSPDVDVRDGVNIESALFGVTRSHGVTTVLVVPQASNVINGLCALFHCFDGAPIAEREVLDPAALKTPATETAALHVSFGGGAKERFAKKDKMPSTRMGVAAVLRRELEKGVAYREKARRFQEKLDRWNAGHKDDEAKPEPPSLDRGMEVLSRALARRIPVIAGADRLDDIRTALRIAEEFNLRLVISGGAESWKIARELAEKKVPVIYGPVVRQPDSPETPGARMDGPRLLREAGVSFCIATMDAHNSRNLPYHAGIAASWGLPEADALAAITRDPARILGVGDLMGTLEPGKEATLCVFQGSPLEPLSRLERMFIRGKEVPLRNRQTDLLEKWK